MMKRKKKWLIRVCGLVWFMWDAISPCWGQSDDRQLKLSDKIEPISEANIFRDADYFNWCSSILKGEDGKYHLFYSRWKREEAFTGWLTHSTIAHAVSVSPEGPYEYLNTVVDFNKSSYRPGEMITAHNPKIKRFNGRYYLYFCSTYLDKAITGEELLATARQGYSHPNWKPLRIHQRTFVASSTSLDKPFKINPKPLLEPSGPIETLVVNPAITQGADKRFYLIVKGDKPGATTFLRNQAITVSKYPDRGFVIQAKPVIKDWDTEDVSMWYDRTSGYYYAVFHAHTYIGMMVSKNGTDWKKADDFTVTPKRLHREGGQPDLIPDQMERPFVLFEEGKAKVLSVAVKKGDDSFIVTIPLKENK